MGLAASRIPLEAAAASGIARKGRIHQSVCQWCYRQMSIDQLAQSAASIGLQGVDLLQPDDYEIPRRYGLICSMGYAGGGEINKALNRAENHAAIEQAFRTNIPRAAKAGVPNVITFSGNRAGNDTNSFWVDGYNLFDLGVRYSTRHLTWRLAVDNVTNEHYWSTVAPSNLTGANTGNLIGHLGSPRTLLASVTLGL